MEKLEAGHGTLDFFGQAERSRHGGALDDVHRDVPSVSGFAPSWVGDECDRREAWRWDDGVPAGRSARS